MSFTYNIWYSSFPEVLGCRSSVLNTASELNMSFTFGMHYKKNWKNLLVLKCPSIQLHVKGPKLFAQLCSNPAQLPYIKFCQSTSFDLIQVIFRATLLKVLQQLSAYWQFLKMYQKLKGLYAIYIIQILQHINSIHFKVTSQRMLNEPLHHLYFFDRSWLNYSQYTIKCRCC